MGELLDRILTSANLRAAHARVVANQGSAGVDGMEVGELKPHLNQNWKQIEVALKTGKYEPQPVRRVEIPKPGGGMRKLGIPTVLDRFIQQAVMQVLQGRWSVTSMKVTNT